jgi:hypothetical protein
VWGERGGVWEVGVAQRRGRQQGERRVVGGEWPWVESGGQRVGAQRTSRHLVRSAAIYIVLLVVVHSRLYAPLWRRWGIDHGDTVGVGALAWGILQWVLGHGKQPWASGMEHGGVVHAPRWFSSHVCVKVMCSSSHVLRYQLPIGGILKTYFCAFAPCCRVAVAPWNMRSSPELSRNR